jgi:putative ABC transport system substrate-binding protein
MNQLLRKIFHRCRADNPKSKACPEPRRRIENPKFFGVAVSVLLAIFAVAGHAQEPKVARIGFLVAGPASAVSTRIEAFRQGLRQVGYVEGKNIVVEYRYGEGKLENVPSLAAELVKLKVDVIVTAGSQATMPAKQATSTIPIVMTQDNDPIGSGLIASFARPGGNVTGLVNLAAELSAKQVELLKEIIPKLKRVAVLRDPSEPGSPRAVKETASAAQGFAVQIQYVDIQAAGEIEPAFKAIAGKRPDALLVMTGALVNAHRKQIVELATKSRLPAMYQRAEYVEDGGLMMYGVNINDMYWRAAIYVDKILKGAKPGELPVEQPTKFDLLFNLKTAKQIGLTIPPNVLVRADKVIK